MTGVIVLDPPEGPEEIRIDVWECPVTAWPAGVAASDMVALGVNDVQQRVREALTLELSTLGIGGGLRLVTVLGGGQCQAVFHRTGALPTAPVTQLGSTVGLGQWTRSAAPLPPIGGDLVTEVLPTDAGLPVPWARFQTTPVEIDGAELSIWSRLADRLAHHPVPTALVVDVVRVGVPTSGQEILLRGLASRAATRAQRSQRRFGRNENDDALPGSSPVGDFVLAVGLVGDIASLISAWRAETGLSLRRADELSIPALNRRLISLMTAPAAAEMLPLPVLSAHSTVPVRRFRPRSTTVTRPVSPEDAVVVARTDFGEMIGFEADTVNRNMLVVGDIGTGKSTTTMSVLTDLWNLHSIPWLVIDPLKYEYAGLRVAENHGGRQHLVPVRHLRLGQTPINPLIVPSGVNPLSFASAMAQAFSSTSALGEAFPLGDQIARTAFNDLYANIPAPTFADLEAALMAASHQEGIAGEAANNIRTSLLGRLRAITSGIAGEVFAGGPRAGIDWADLSRFPTVITFPPGIGQQEKTIIYAMLVAAHWSWRLANPTHGRHLIVLEEVHQVYGRSNPAAASVLDSLLATMRASGQGYLAVTQTPHQLDEQTQRLFQNTIVHRIRHREGLGMLQSLGVANAEVQDLDDGEVVALFHETSGVRGRVTDSTAGARHNNPMTPVDSHRAEEFAVPGPAVRGWCSACPRPCRGRSWLSMASVAAAAADASLATSPDLRGAALAAVRATQEAAVRAAGATIDNPAGLYCASARGVTVALGVRGAAETVTRMASSHVRNLIVNNSL